MNVLKRIVDGMAATKLNIFHWYATDSQSFPLKNAPQNTKFGSYSLQETYHKNEVIEFNEYARLRGVRIIMELNMPAHVVCINLEPWRHYCVEPPCFANRTNGSVYRILRDIYHELIEFVPPEEGIHMGSDEVFFNCRNLSVDISGSLNNLNKFGRNKENFLKLWYQYHSMVRGIWDKERANNCCREDECKSPIILWSSDFTQPEHIEKYLSSARYIIQTCAESSNPLPEQLLLAGYKLIISTRNAWYLDHGFSNNTSFYQWRTVYDNRIERHPNILGGEACMWTEFVDGNSIETRIYPRAAAFGERLWSDPETKSCEAELRFYRHRQRLIDRGVKNDAVASRWCVYNEGEC